MVAPFAGIASQKPDLGDYVSAGVPVMSIVADEEVWIEANFKETDLTRVRPGQAATVAIDTYPDRAWPATVDEHQPRRPVREFSVLPAQNATGNWVKVVQRIPVRIALEAGPDDPPLRAGMSVTVEIDTGHRRELPGFVADRARLGGLRRRADRGAAPRAQPIERDQRDDAPAGQPALITVSVMLATIMQALDTTIANVALPHMQGSMSATQDQIAWVLTSYIVAAAIMTPPTGWLAARFGRKRLFLVAVTGFTLASMLCGVATSLEQLVLFRLLQGVFGAGAGAAVAGGAARHLPARAARPGDGDVGRGRDGRPDPRARRSAAG